MTLKVHYNVQPWFGALTWDTQGDYGKWRAMAGGVSNKFTLPSIKKKAEETKKP